MTNRDDAVGLAEGAVLSSGLLALFYYLLIALNGYGNTLVTFVVMFGFPVAATATLSVLFLPKFRLASSSLGRSQVLASLVYQLRNQGLRVEQAAGYATIRLGTTVALRVHVRASREGSVVSYQAYATPAGWGNLITLIVLLWTSPAAFGAILYTFRKARRFAWAVVEPQLRRVDSGGGAESRDETHALLISSLSEGQRLAAEAYEAARSAYADTVAVIGMIGVLAGGLTFAALLMAPPGLLRVTGGTVSLTMSVVVGVATAVVLYMLVRRRTLPQLQRHKLWSERLQKALAREAARTAPEATEPSSVELLVDASGRIPEWLAARQRTALTGDQAADWIVFILAFWAVWAYYYGIWMVFQPDIFPALAAILGGVVLSLGAFFAWKYWKRKEDAAKAAVLREWRRRTQALRSKMDRLLEEM